MKITFLSMTSGLVHRGVETFVDALATRLAAAHDVTVYQGERTDATFRVVEIPGVTGVTTDVEGSWRAKLLRFVYGDAYSRQVRRFTRQVLPFLAEEKPEIVIPVNGGWQTRWVRNCVRGYGGKVVISGQAGVGYDDWWNLQHDPDVFVALTPTAVRWAQKVRPDIRIEKIPNGVDLDTFTQEGRHYPFFLKRPIILTVAGLNRYKRVDLVLRAVATLPSFSVVVCGQGHPDEEERVDFLGRLLLGRKRYQRLVVPHAKMPMVYRAAAVFTLPSLGSEAFGISIVEAMATNLPVVLPDDENRRWIAGKAGFFVQNVEEVDQYARVLSSALQKKKAMPRREAERFSWDTIAATYEKILQSLMEER